MIPLWYAMAMVRLVADRVAGAERDDRGSFDNLVWVAVIVAGVLLVAGIIVAKMKSRAEATPTE